MATDGSSYVITGSGWGSAPGAFSFLGGLGGNYDSGTPGADLSAPGWSFITGIAEHAAYASTPVLSRANSLGFDSRIHQVTNPFNSGAFGVKYDVGSGQTEIFYSVNIFYAMDNTLTQSQQKFWRLMPVDDVADTQPQRYFTHWRQGNVEGDGDACANPNNVSPLGSGQGPLNGAIVMGPTGGPNISRYPDTFPDNNTGEWYHVRLWQLMSSALATADGQWKMYIMRISDGAVMMDNEDHGIVDYLDATRIRYFVMQHYFGNAQPTNPPEAGQGRCFEDDSYLQYGSGAGKFLLVGDASTYGACTVFAIQPWSSWATGSITFDLNKGPLSSVTTCYAYPMSDVKTPFSTTGILVGSAPTFVPAWAGNANQ